MKESVQTKGRMLRKKDRKKLKNKMKIKSLFVAKVRRIPPN
jgi:hypothetical protein